MFILDAKKKVCVFFLLTFTNVIYANTFRIIDIMGNHPAKNKLVAKTSKYLGIDMSDGSIANLYKDLSNTLNDEGYITSKVVLVSGNVNEGKISFEIESGKIGKIYFSDSKNNPRMIKTAFNIKEGSDFNIKDLDQGVENLNIGGKNYKLEIVGNDVIIHDSGNEYQKSINVTLDNSPSKFLHTKLDVSTEKYNLLNLNDTLRISANTRLNPNIFRDFDTKLNFGYIIPNGYKTYRYNLGLSSSMNKQLGQTGKDIKTTSFNINQKFDFSKIIYKDKDQKTVFNANLGVDKANTWVSGVKIDVQSLWNIYTTQSLNYTKSIENGSYSIKGSQEIGINNPYFKYTFDANLDKNYFLENKNTLSYLMKSGGGFVFSPNKVLDKNKITIGDESTVRGFKKSSISGEIGAYVNNTLTYRMRNTNFAPYIGLDFGITKDHSLDNPQGALGFSLGFGHKINGYNINAAISKGFIFPIDNKTNENYAIYLSVNKRF